MPHKGKCIRCGEKGHFVRNCPIPWGNAPPAEPVVSVSGVSRDDLTPAVAGAEPPSAADPPAGDPPAPDSVVEVMLKEGGAAPVSGVPPSCADGSLPTPQSKPGSKSKPGSDLPLASKSTSGSCITDSVLALSSKSKGANKKSAKKCMGHLPAGLASASRMFTRSKH